MTDEGRRSHWVEPQAWCAPVLVAVAATAIQPWGDFPILDDFDYIATVQDYRRFGEMRLSDWPSMTLVGQIWWGSFFASVFGESFLALRVSTLVLLGIGGVAAYCWMRGRGAGRSSSAFVACAITLSPQTLYFGCSFMTDVPGLALTLTTLWACTRALESEGKGSALAASLATSIAYLFRQTAVIPAIAAVMVELSRRRWRRAILLAALPMVTASAYRVWLVRHGIPHHYSAPIIDTGTLTNITLLAERIARILATTGLYLVPIAAMWLGRFALFSLVARRTGIAATAVAVTASIFVPAFSPYDSTAVFDCGLGSDCSLNRLDVLEGWGVLAFGRSCSMFRIACSLLSAASLGVCAAVIVQSRNRSWEPTERLLAFSIGGCTLFALISGSFYERYLIPVWSLAMLPLALTAPKPSFRAWFVVLAVASIGVVGSQDFFCRFRAVWSALDELQAEGVHPAAIDAGMEFAGWRQFNPRFRGKPERVPPYISGLSDKERIDLIAPMVVNPFTPYRLRLPFAVSYADDREKVLRKRSYQSWVRSGEVFMLKRIRPSPENAGRR